MWSWVRAPRWVFCNQRPSSVRLCRTTYHELLMSSRSAPKVPVMQPAMTFCNRPDSCSSDHKLIVCLVLSSPCASGLDGVSCSREADGAGMWGLVTCNWPRGVTVSTLDSESSDRGSNPREAFSHFSESCMVAAVLIGNELTKPAPTLTTATRLCC